MYTLNIGLGNNPCSPTEIADMLRYNDLIDFEVKSGTYKEVPENTLVADVAKMEISMLIEICKECEQECVAVFDNCTRTGKLIYQQCHC